MKSLLKLFRAFRRERLKNGHRCLRCKTVLLVEVEHHPGIRFFDCPNCGRRYALKPHKQLTFRWLHPITLALYGVIFDRAPVERAGSIAQSFVEQKSPEQLDRIVKEIRLELNDPTQQVRDTLSCVASEEELRRYLWAFVGRVEQLQNGPR